MAFLKPRWALEWWAIVRNEGIKSFVQQKGWKLLVALFAFYLVRDTILYIIIPYLIASRLAGCD